MAIAKLETVPGPRPSPYPTLLYRPGPTQPPMEATILELDQPQAQQSPHHPHLEVLGVCTLHVGFGGGWQRQHIEYTSLY